MIEEIGEKIFRYAILSAFVVIFVGGVFCAYPVLVQSQDLKRESDRLSERIEAKRNEIAKLVDNQRRFRVDPDFVEKIARENNRVYPGELVFVFGE